MKVAVITDDGLVVSQHFGRAGYYLVITIEDGQIVERELRNKLGHAHFVNQPHEQDEPGQPHGTGAEAHHKHLQMSDTIADCEALLCGGMGRGAYQSILSRGIKPEVTDIPSADHAALAYARGEIENLVDRLH
jgi:predicted Fe-Mo cluster-binding NifX family protein